MTKPMLPAEFTAIRERLGISKAALARAMRVSRKTISLIENEHIGITGPYEIALRALGEGYRPEGTVFPCDKKES